MGLLCGPLPGMIFFNPEHGLEVASGYNLFIPDQDNPWYAGGTEGSATADTEAVEGDGAMSLVYYSNISGAWAHHLVKEYDIPGIAFPGVTDHMAGCGQFHSLKSHVLMYKTSF